MHFRLGTNHDHVEVINLLDFRIRKEEKKSITEKHISRVTKTCVW